MSAIFSDPPQPPTPSRMPPIPSVSPIRSSGPLRKRQSTMTSPTRSKSALFTSSLETSGSEQQHQSTKKRRMLGEIEINTLQSPSSFNGHKAILKSSPIKVILKAKDGAASESTSAEASLSDMEASSFRRMNASTEATVDRVDDRSSATPPLSPREHLLKHSRSDARRQSAPPAIGDDVAAHLRTMRLRLAFARFKVENGLIGSTADQVLTEMQSSDTENDAAETTNEDEETWWESYHHAHHLSESKGHQPLCTCT